MAGISLEKAIKKKADEAAEQYRRADLFWNCSTMSDSDIERQRSRFLSSYEDVFQSIEKVLFPANQSQKERQEAQEYLKKQGLDTVFQAYKDNAAKNDPQKSNVQKQGAEQDQNGLMDPSITPEQRQGLQEFHQWMYRNCDRQGIKYFGRKLFGADGSARNFVEKFMSQPVSVQLKAMYLLEKHKRKTPDEKGVFGRESQKDYVPNLENLKSMLTAVPWKVWKRTNGSYLYWHKLNEALEAAEDGKEELLKFREEANKLAKENPNTYRDSPQFQDALSQIQGKAGEAGEYQGKIDKLADASDGINGMSDMNGSLQSLASDIETSIKQIKNGGKVLKKEDEVSGYITRLVEKIAGEKVAQHYDNQSTLALSAVSLISGGISIYNGIKERIELSGVQRGIGQVSDTIDIGTTGSYAVQTASDITGTIGNYAEAAEKFAKSVGRVGTGAFGVANLLIAAKGGIEIGAGVNGKKHAEAARAFGEELNDKEIKNRAGLSKFLNEKKTNKGIRGVIQGSSGAAAAGIALFASGVPIAGQALGLISLSVSLYEGYVQSNKDLREKYRKGIDTEFFGGKEGIEAEDKKYSEMLKKRLQKFKEGSEGYKKIRELCSDKNKNKRFDILRKEKAIKENCVFMRDCYEKAITGIAEDAYRNVFYIDPSKGGTYKNLITKENYAKYFSTEEVAAGDSDAEKNRKAEHNRQVKVRLSYKELMESFGAKAEFSSSKEKEETLTKKNNKSKTKLTPEELNKKKEEAVEKETHEKAEKISTTFLKM